MKTISAGLSTHLSGEVTTWATCWRVTLRNGTVYGFTDHDEDLELGGITYLASSGYTPSEIQTASDFSVDNLNIVGFLDSPVILEDDFLAGLWDYAEISLFRVNWADLTQSVMHERRGWLGEVSLKRGQFTSELRGLLQALTRPIIELYSPGCRARLHDVRCTKDLTDYTQTFAVSAVTNDRQFTATITGSPQTVRLSASTTGTPTDNYFRGGLLTFLSGLNDGLDMEVKAYTASSGLFVLQLPMPYAVAAGDAFSAYAGCDKAFATCRDLFDNVLNFRGEPSVPGLDKVLRPGGL